MSAPSADHEHKPYQQHHFESMEQQTQSTMLGIWLFLGQEIMFFGGLFAAYAVYRVLYPTAWKLGSITLDPTLGLINTIVLIGSSVTIVFAVHAARHGSKNGVLGWFLATLLLGGVFLGIKSVEYGQKHDHGLIPGVVECGEKTLWAWDDEHALYYINKKIKQFKEDRGHYPVEGVEKLTELPKGIKLYYSLYFAMSGMHALHMIIGFGLAVWILVKNQRGRFNAEYYPHVEYFGLYWHFVDIVWIFLFPLLYLV